MVKAGISFALRDEVIVNGGKTGVVVAIVPPLSNPRRAIAEQLKGTKLHRVWIKRPNVRRDVLRDHESYIVEVDGKVERVLTWPNVNLLKRITG